MYNVLRTRPLNLTSRFLDFHSIQVGYLEKKSEERVFKVDFCFFRCSCQLRPGARFGPTGIREGSRRTTLVGGYNIPQAVNPLDNWATVVDCGDAFITQVVYLLLFGFAGCLLTHCYFACRPYDNAAALSQMQRAYERVLYRSPVDLSRGKYLRIISLGGDHTITLPILRALKSVYGPVSIIHFDSHLDTWRPEPLLDSSGSIADINHGTYFLPCITRRLACEGRIGARRNPYKAY